MEIINTDRAPKPIGAYSQAIKAGDFLFTSGQICSGEACSKKDIAAQTEEVIKNLLSILEKAKLDIQSVVKTTVYLSDMKDFKKMNEVYGKYFGSVKPARSTVAVKTLPKDVKIEMDLVAYSKVK